MVSCSLHRPCSSYGCTTCCCFCWCLQCFRTLCCLEDHRVLQETPEKPFWHLWCAVTSFCEYCDKNVDSLDLYHGWEKSDASYSVVVTCSLIFCASVYDTFPVISCVVFWQFCCWSGYCIHCIKLLKAVSNTVGVCCLGTDKCIRCGWTVCTCSVLCRGEGKEAGSDWERVESRRGLASCVSLALTHICAYSLPLWVCPVNRAFL